MSVYIDIPMKPTPKGRPRMTRSGHTYTPDKTRAAEVVVKRDAQDAMGNATVPSGPVRVIIQLTFKQAKSNKTSEHTQRPDADNCAKLVTDALNGVAYLDDSQIVRLEVEKLWGTEDRVEVWVDEVGI